MSEIAAVEPERAYLRVATDIERRITEGELHPGQRLLSERALAEFYEVSYGTIRRATQVLRDKQLIESRHGHGTFVSGSRERPGT